MVGFSRGKSDKIDLFLKNKNVILPNFITILGVLCGVYSIILSSAGSFVYAAYALILAAIFDFLDGRVARLMKGTSDFGIQLDSLCDMVSFGVAPVLLAYNYALEDLGRVGIMGVFLFVATGALRLARFNVQASRGGHSEYFVGLPIPISAAYIASFVIFITNLKNLNIDFLNNVHFESIINISMTVSVYILAFLMVSSIPYYSFKKVRYFKEHPFNTLVILVIFIFVVGLYFEIIFFIIAIMYISAGMLLALFRMKKSK